MQKKVTAVILGLKKVFHTVLHKILLSDCTSTEKEAQPCSFVNIYIVLGSNIKINNELRNLLHWIWCPPETLPGLIIISSIYIDQPWKLKLNREVICYADDRVLLSVWDEVEDKGEVGGADGQEMSGQNPLALNCQEMY